jgi:hypothetical protein
MGNAPRGHAALNNLIIGLLHHRVSPSLAQSLRELGYQIERHLTLLDLLNVDLDIAVRWGRRRLDRSRFCVMLTLTQ